jgi:hypothetical protein
MKRLLLVILLVISVVSVGCFYEEKVPVSDLPSLNNDLIGGTYSASSEVEGFTFMRQFSTNYDTSTWRITDSKALLLEAWAIGGADEVLVEHVHIDIALKATRPFFDGITQDSMDDSIHGGEQPGFVISDTHSYQCVFAIEGYSDTFLRGWGYACQYYGYAKVSEHRPSESGLRHEGVYGEKVQVVWDLVVRSPGENLYHTVSVLDEFLVPTPALATS